MELCVTQLLPALPSQRTTCAKNPIYLQSEPSTFLHRNVLFRSSFALQSRRGFCSLRRCGLDNSVSRAAISEERSGGSGSNQYVTEEREEVIIDSSPPEKKVYGEYVIPEVPKNEELTGETGTETFLDNLKVDSVDPYGILVFGTSSVVGLWLASAVVGAIDSIPVFPKLLEVVGLGYTLWFTSRYLLFKESRDELGAKIEELKNQVVGSDD